MRRLGKTDEFALGERGGNQQNRIRPVGAGFNNLVLIHHEVFAQTGKRDRRRGQLQIAQAALEVWLIGENGERRRAARLAAPGQPLNVEVRANQPPGGRRLFDLRDHRRPHRSLPSQSRGPAARLMRSRLPFQFCNRHMRFRNGHRGPRRSQNCVQVSRHALSRVYGEDRDQPR